MKLVPAVAMHVTKREQNRYEKKCGESEKEKKKRWEKIEQQESYQNRGFVGVFKCTNYSGNNDQFNIWNE